MCFSCSMDLLLRKIPPMGWGGGGGGGGGGEEGSREQTVKHCPLDKP